MGQKQTTEKSDCDFHFKLIVVGDDLVGKSNLMMRFTSNEFRLEADPTMGMEIGRKQLVIENKIIHTETWDTARETRFDSVITQFYRDIEGVLVVFDLTNSESFDHIVQWIENIHQHTTVEIPIVLIGNKSDLVAQRKVTHEQATDLAKQHNLSYIETSALNSFNVEQAFVSLITDLLHKKMREQIYSLPTISVLVREMTQSGAVQPMCNTCAPTQMVAVSASEPVKISQGFGPSSFDEDIDHPRAAIEIKEDDTTTTNPYFMGTREINMHPSQDSDEH